VVGVNCIIRIFITCTLQQVKLLTIKSRRMRWTGHVARVGEKKNAYKILVGKPEGNEHTTRKS
jgi:hypothetical protein